MDDDPARELRRVVARLHALGPSRLSGPAGESVRVVLQGFADLAAQQRGEPRRIVPRLGEHALADQLVALMVEIDLSQPAAAAQVAGRLAQVRRGL